MASKLKRSVQFYYDVISPHAWITFENAYEKMYKRGTLTAMKLLTATEQTKPELTQMLSRSLWMRMWSKAGKDIGVPESDMEYLLLKSKEKGTTVKLRSTTEEALLNGVFNAPTMILDDVDYKKRVLSGPEGMYILALLLNKDYESPISNPNLIHEITPPTNTESGLYESPSSSTPGKDEKTIKPT
ncbi:hypothetical protein LSH36_820g00077 [Paralvinella palmiformis]|uniref:DSBA-like thioredoxin domain-containing protein n=1 Tax=Paralvinella palmiformis TaxID=53620 RepID=A0AAD9IZY0_9ANNE|nr:hypothetical protein LSH36_820g00077 [Paralvinella palmiformis]